MYTITRQEAADILNISTRSIDRYIRAGKLRSQKDGKIIFINDKDIQNLKSSDITNQEIISPEKEYNEVHQRKYRSDEEGSYSKSISFRGESLLEPIYNDLREEIKKKDEVIQTLSLRL